MPHFLSLKAWLMVGILVGFLLLSTSVQAYSVPTYEGLVNDYAEVLSPEFESQLETRLQGVAAASNGAELAVVTIQTLDGETVEDVSQQFFDTWKLGKKGIDNGVLFLVAIEDRKMRIHTGYGTEVVVPDSVAGRILNLKVTPLFKEGDYEGGTQVAVDDLLKYVDNPAVWEELNTSAANSNSWKDWGEMVIAIFVLSFAFVPFLVTIIIYIVSFLGRSKSWWFGGIAGGLLGYLFYAGNGALIFGIIGLVLDYILSRNYERWKMKGWSTSWSKTSGGFYSSGSSSGGGFSSGGGSSGGGGASGGW